MVVSSDLTEVRWERLAPLPAPPKRLGRPRAEYRTTLSGILFVLRNGLRPDSEARHFSSRLSYRSGFSSTWMWLKSLPSIW